MRSYKNRQMKQLMITTSCVVMLLAGAGSSQAQLVPERIVLNATADPATSMALTWRTGKAAASFAEVVLAEANPEFEKKAIRVKAVTQVFRPDSIYTAYHSVVLKQLQPNTLYAYRVGNDSSWSEWFQVKTAGKAGEPLSFIYLGDAQNSIKSLWSRTIREAFSRLPKANLVMHAGDLVNRGNRDEEWGEFFYAGSFIHSMIPGFMSPGNHEYAKDSAGEFSLLTPLWRAQFTLPQNGPKGLEETCYYSDIQGVRFISLNSQEINLSEAGARLQWQWLDTLLQNNPNKWTCIIFHHPVFSVKASRDNERLRAMFKPLFDKYRVDLVLQGHDHAYARGMDKVPMPHKETVSGTMYVVSVSGPKMYEGTFQPWMDKTTMNQQLFQLVNIAGDSLSFKAYTTTGELFDAFTLVKQKGKPNKCINGK
jgi:hypothetical protein